MAYQSKAFSLESEDFKHNEAIPVRFTCDGENKPPRLSWFNIPEDAETLVLICDDPDAPQPKPWVHWVVYNIPINVDNLDHVMSREPVNIDGSMQGENSSSSIGYDGPCPPKGHGVHHYHFKLYALKTTLKLNPGATKEQVEAAMKGNVLAHTELVGTYQRK